MRILSLQSHVVDGAVGNAAAVLPMQRLGAEVLPVHTLQFSNHPGDGPVGGDVFAADHIARVLAGLEARGAPARLDAVLTGYLGTDQIGAVAAETLSRWRGAHPGLRLACDPVIGDSAKGVYVGPALAALIRDRLVPMADIVFPNLFELQWLTGMAVDGEAALGDAIAALHRMGPGAVVVTSVDLPGDEGATGFAVSSGDGVGRLVQPRMAGAFSGAGDCFAAMCLVHWLRGMGLEAAVGRAGAVIHALVTLTASHGRCDLALVEGQNLIA